MKKAELHALPFCSRNQWGLADQIYGYYSEVLVSSRNEVDSLFGTLPNYLSQIMQSGSLFADGMPTLLYITKQEFGGQKHDRAMHSHDSLCEILLVYRGLGSYRIRDRSYPIQAGDILFYNQGEAHEVCSTLDAEIGTYCFGISGLHFKGLPINHITSSDSPPVRPSGATFEFLRQLSEHAYLLLASDEAGKAAAQCLAASFLLIAHKLEGSQHVFSADRQDAQMANRIQAYLDAHYTEPITLQSIADAFQCSAPYVSHVFKKIIGYSPIQYVIRRRIGLAQSYLISSDYSATQIATLVGYDNTNYFNTLFTKIVGLSPIRYKRQYLELLRGNATQ